MKNTVLIASTLMALLAFGCKKDDENNPSTSTQSPTPPSANFTYTGAGIFAPATVQFTNTSTNATSFLWDFGDNGTSTQQDPSHTYTNGGTYTVRLTATGAGGSNSITKTVNISNRPTTAKLTYIRATDWSVYNSSGSPWDFSNAPDVYFQVQDVSSNVLADFSGTVFYDATPSIRLDLSTPYTIPSLTTNYYIQLYDYDELDPDDDMGYVGFNMNNYPTYPSTITITNNSFGITVELGIQWQ